MMLRTATIAALFLVSGWIVDVSYARADEHRGKPMAQAPCPYMKGKKHHDPEALFAGMDSDGSGDVSADEFVAWHEKMLREKFTHIDDDGDGKVSKTELKLHHEQMKRRMQMMNDEEHDDRSSKRHKKGHDHD